MSKIDRAIAKMPERHKAALMDLMCKVQLDPSLRERAIRETGLTPERFDRAFLALGLKLAVS